jgi:hypothetical protein
MMLMSTTTPPTAPPAMAPTFVFFDGVEVDVGSADVVGIALVADRD